MKIVSLSSNFFSVSIWTLASRILGFVRDILMAAFLGTGPLAEAFLVAFSLPNMFRRFFAEGALNMAFVPLFSKKLDVDKSTNSDRLIGMEAVVCEEIHENSLGRVKIDGDFWQAKEINGKYVSVGTRVKVINYQSIVLIIKIIK